MEAREEGVRRYVYIRPVVAPPPPSIFVKREGGGVPSRVVLLFGHVTACCFVVWSRDP